jgi:predicted protein tyrosine phosphatase
LEAVLAKMHKRLKTNEFIPADMEFLGEIACIASTPIYVAISDDYEYLAPDMLKLLEGKLILYLHT